MKIRRIALLLLPLLIALCGAWGPQIIKGPLPSGPASGFTWLPSNDTNLFYWWVATDLPQGTVSTGWVDRIHGIRLTNGIAANQPSVSSNYVSFSTHYLSNSINGAMTHWMWGMILSAPGPWAGSPSRKNLWDRIVDGASGTLGWCFRSSYYLYNNAADPRDFTPFTNGIIFDLCILKTNSSAGPEVTFTNGVHSDDFTFSGSLDLGPKMGIGNTADQTTYPFTGKIYEILIWTNGPNIITDVQILVSNFHRYATNRYGPYYIP